MVEGDLPGERLAALQGGQGAQIDDLERVFAGSVIARGGDVVRPADRHLERADARVQRLAAVVIAGQVGPIRAEQSEVGVQAAAG